ERLGAPSRGDVLAGADVAGHPAVLGDDRFGAHVDPAYLPPRGQHAELALVLALLAYRRHPACGHGGAVVRMDGALPSVSQGLLRIDAGDLAPARVGVDAAACCVGPEHPDG